MKEEQADIQRAADEQQPTYPAVGEWGGTAEPPTVGEVSINYSQKCHFILLEAFTVAPQYNIVPRDWGNGFVIAGVRYNEFLQKTSKTSFIGVWLIIILL